MVSGEKLEEFRDVTPWIESRLFDKDGSKRIYDLIQYVNGYGSDRPSFTTDFLGFDLLCCVNKKYSNGLIVDINNPVYVIRHSKVLTTKNI